MIQSICCTPVHKFTLTASTKCLPCSYFCVIPLLAQFTQSIVVNINSPEVCHSMSELSSSVSSSSSQINTAYMSESRVFIWASHLKRNSCFYHKRAVWSSMDLLLLHKKKPKKKQPHNNNKHVSWSKPHRKLFIKYCCRCFPNK